MCCTTKAEAVALHVLLGGDSDDSSRRSMNKLRQSCASYAVQGFWTVFNGYGLRDSKWSPFMKESWDKNLGISADLIVAQAVHHYIFLKILTEMPLCSIEVLWMTKMLLIPV
ncbi:hypothetical protein IGI04_037623 [Brassica rapa subsp. trilocularis]|uniref:Uncharacterized protein n=1 Tax=Brassica rapa subsp. trilocularis TaxID=1813537 RepID=A0ABQ7LHZ4_BRACM|nr:hypothetical protein IGI04_037623 [Brassica rapa subsp. trilocularis]